MSCLVRCRTCLQKCYESNSTTVSEIDQQFDCKYSDIIALICGVTVQKFNKICEKCKRTLQAAYKFRIQVQQVDEKLKTSSPISDSESDSDNEMESQQEPKDLDGITIQEAEQEICNNGDNQNEPDAENGAVFDRSHWLCQNPEELEVYKTETIPKDKYLCPDCGQLLAQRTAFIRHCFIHTDKKKYVCDYCHKVYHVRKHTGDTPLVCPYCGRKFGKPLTFQHHVRTHTGEKPHKCDICSASFIQKYSLKLHIRKNHPIEQPTGD